VVSLPVTILNSPKAASRDGLEHPDFGTERDIAGVILWSIGWLIETYADLHKVHCPRLLSTQSMCLTSSTVHLEANPQG